MKILYILRTSEFKDGGSIAFRNMVDGLQSYEVEMSVVLLKEGGISEWLHEHGISYSIIGEQDFFAWSTPKGIKACIKFPYYLFHVLFTNIRATIRVYRIIKREKPDIVHTNNIWMISGYFACKLAKVKHLWHIREYFDALGYHFIPSFSRLKSWLGNSYTLSITPDVAMHYACNDSKKDFFCFDGVSHVGNVQYMREKENYFLFVGAVHPFKGCSIIVDAFVEFAQTHSSTRMLFAGVCSDSYKRELQDKLRQCGLLERVEFLGFRTDVYDLMAHAKALIVASKLEALGFITIEALLNGCLVIGKNVGCTKLIFDEIGNDSLRFLSTKDLVHCLSFVSDSPFGFFESKILEAQKVVSRNFSIERCAENTYNIYKKILS